MNYGVSLNLPLTIPTLSSSVKPHNDGSYEASAQHHSSSRRPIAAADERQVLSHPPEHFVEPPISRTQC